MCLRDRGAPRRTEAHLCAPRRTAMAEDDWQLAAPHLLQALHHHSGLSSLLLDLRCIDAAAVRLLCPALASLTSLHSLHLCAITDPETPALLGATFAAMPALKHFGMVLVSNIKPRKRPRLASGPRPCLAGMLSTATALTSLDLTATSEAANFCASAPLRLQSLVQLSMAMTQPEALGSVLHHLSSPLTRLDLMNSMHGDLPGVTANHFEHFFSSLAQQKTLKNLALVCPRTTLSFGGPCRDALDAVRAHAPPALGALHQLQEIHLKADLSTIARCFKRAQTANLLALTWLCLDCRLPYSSTAQLQPWPTFIERVSRLPLRHLDLCLIDGPYGGHSIAPLLRKLTALTALRVHGWDCLRSSTDATALAAMPRLHKLHLLCMSVATEMPACARALADLSTLTNLAIALKPRVQNAVLVAALAADAPARLWPELQQLCLVHAPRVEIPDTALSFAATLATRTQLTLNLHVRRTIADAYRSWGGAPAAEVLHIQAAAKAAGVPLCIDQDFPF